MCAIVDTMVASEVFSDTPSDAGRHLREWINSGQNRLIVGGHLLYELKKNKDVYAWIQEALIRGNAKKFNPHRVTKKEKELKKHNRLRSDDGHTIALAQLSGARLLFSNDLALQRDFLDGKLIHSPFGNVYTTVHDKSKSFTPKHASLLETENLCGGVCI